ncbi:putative uncharacterized protein [Burkholderiales bacterium GJ-E10]|nr:putative uncharacterized protein [Burkholderiales bacterium GJ-E10]
MTLHYKWLTQTVATAAQIHPGDLPAIAAHGFKTLINNRPDGEGGPNQPTSKELEEAAREHGIAYVYLPVVPMRYTREQVEAMAQHLKTAATPVLAFCRSGARTEQLFHFTQQLG